MTTHDARTRTPHGGPSSEDDRVHGTVFKFDRFQIRKFQLQGLTLLEVIGEYTNNLGKRLERVAAQINTHIGLDLSRLTNMQPGILPSLQAIKKRLAGRDHTFVLSHPPERLRDILSLNDLVSEFAVAESIDSLMAATKSPSIVSDLSAPPDQEGDTAFALELSPAPVSREIAQFNHSLKRTEKLEKSLDSASECIRKILPQRPPTQLGYDFAFSYVPCDKVGGDFFDFIRTDPDTLFVTIGDVSGHGLDSAIVMGMSKKVLRMRTKDLANRSTADILTQVNHDLHEDLGAKIFVTALLARIHLPTGDVRFARAGHEPPVVFQPGAGTHPDFVNAAGIALGIDSGARFRNVIEEKSFTLAPGAGLLLYTDGIVESWNSRRTAFSRTRLAYTVERLQKTSCAETIIESIEHAIAQFSMGTPQEDDMTSIVILRD